MSLTLRTAVAGQAVEPAAWYRRNRPCAECRAEVLRRVERDGIAYIDVKHPDSCSLGRAATASAGADAGTRPRRKSLGTGSRPSPKSAS